MKWIHVAGTLALAAAAMNVSAAGGQDVLNQQCIACHAVSKPDKLTLERLWERKGPDLYYAGLKFNRDWLVGWLQNPTTIRPGSMLPAKYVKGADGKGPDTIDLSQVAAHPKLSAADAALAADALMALKADGLVEKGAFKNEPVNASMAAMLLSKLRGCTSCHAAKPGSGGSSGPELYTAGDRLQPDFVVAYINDPHKFDPHVWMPRLGLKDADVQKLAGYLATFKSAEKK